MSQNTIKRFIVLKKKKEIKEIQEKRNNLSKQKLVSLHRLKYLMISREYDVKWFRVHFLGLSG